MGAALTMLGSRLEEEVIIKEGYSIDAVLQRKDGLVAIEVDGPSHFLQGPIGQHRSVSGATQLKRRQLKALGWQLVSVPYWEWGTLMNKEAKSKCLSRLLESTQRPQLPT